MIPANPATAEVALFLSDRFFIKLSQSYLMRTRRTFPVQPALCTPRSLALQQDAGFFRKRKDYCMGTPILFLPNAEIEPPLRCFALFTKNKEGIHGNA